MSLTITRDRVPALLKSIADLVKQQVLVGVPAANAAPEPGSDINKAALAYIHDNGSPAANIPARPFMRPGIDAAQAALVAGLKGAAGAALDGNDVRVAAKMIAVGMAAAGSIKDTITEGIQPELQPATIANRFRQRGTATRRASEIAYLDTVKAGVPPAFAQAEAGIIPLVNTGELRNAITYVIRGK